MRNVSLAEMRRKGASFGAAGAAALGLGYFISRNTYDLQAYVVILLALAVAAVLVLLPHMAAREKRIFLWILVAGLLAKVAASLFQLRWSYIVKSGEGDVTQYDLVGRTIATHIRNLEFDQVASSFSLGTDVVKIATGALYAAIGPTILGGALVFAFLAFVGSFCYYKGFRVAFPGGNTTLYALLVFLYPSLVYWPSLQGKDALLVFAIGLTAYGLALALRRGGIRGIVLLALGLVVVSLIRPHIAVLLTLAAWAAFLFRPLRMGALSPIVRLGMLCVGVGLSWVVITAAAGFLDLKTISVDSILDFYNLRLQYVDYGGSGYVPPSLTDPLGIPEQIGTLFFRPFPWETHRPEALILSIESLGLLGLTLYRARSLGQAFLSLRSNPYMVFILIYGAMFIVMYMSIGNFSILGRQRLMFFPFYFMLLAHPRATHEGTADAHASQEGHTRV